MIQLRYEPWSKLMKDRIYYLYDTVTKRQYKHIEGGVAIGTNGKGHAVILGMAYHANPQTKLREISILDEHAGIPRDLHAWMTRQRTAWQCERWYGNDLEEAQVSMWHKLNSESRSDKKVYVMPAPNVEDDAHWYTHLAMIRDGLAIERKILRLGNSGYAARLQGLPEVPALPNDPTLTPLVALGYAYSGMIMYGH